MEQGSYVRMCAHIKKKKKEAQRADSNAAQVRDGERVRADNKRPLSVSAS